MDPDDADAQAMAQMMGFSSFERPQKKRRYNNPATDAVVDAPAPAQQQPASTGSNAIPMGSTRKTTTKASSSSAAPATANTDEINLDDDDDSDGGGQGAPLGHPPPDVTASTIPSEHAKGGLLLHGLPQRPARGVPSHTGGPTPGQPWYEGYYDSLSNRNPWEKLEKEMGLQPRGSWISS